MEKNLGGIIFLEIILNEIPHLFCILRFVVWITEVRQIYDFRLFNSNGIPIFFWKRAQMTNLASYKSIDILTLIYLPSWALNSIGLIVAESPWNCAGHVEFCGVVIWYSILYYRNMVLLVTRTNTNTPTYMLALLNNITFLFI